MKVFVHDHAGFFLWLNRPWSAFLVATMVSTIVAPSCFPQAVAAVATQVISRKLWGGCPFVLMHRACKGEVRGEDSRLYALLGRWAPGALLVQPAILFLSLAALLCLWPSPLAKDIIRSICVGFLIGWGSRQLTTRRRAI